MRFTVAVLALAVLAMAQAPPGPPGQQVRIVSTVLRLHGFEPADIPSVAGRTFLLIHNRTGLQDISLIVERQVGPQQKQLVHSARAERRHRWTATLELTPGTYVITEANFPKLACRVTVAP